MARVISRKATSTKGLLVLSVVACLVSSLSATQVANAQTAPVPDFSSNQAAWDGIGPGDFLAVPGSPLPVTQDPRYPRVSNATSRLSGGHVNYRMGDISNPNLKQWAREIMQKDNDEILAGKIAFTARSSCMPSGVPNFIAIGGGLMYFLQSPDLVVMFRDGNSQMRRIHLNVPHSENPTPSWYGESVGHYEGDTLVVDTIGLSDESFIDSYRTPHTEKLHVIERWSLFDGGEGLEAHITIDDPDTFNHPWQTLRRFQRESEIYGEEICAENNQRVFDYGVPSDDTPDF